MEPRRRRLTGRWKKMLLLWNGEKREKKILHFVQNDRGVRLQ